MVNRGNYLRTPGLRWGVDRGSRRSHLFVFQNVRDLSTFICWWGDSVPEDEIDDVMIRRDTGRAASQSRWKGKEFKAQRRKLAQLPALSREERGGERRRRRTAQGHILNKRQTWTGIHASHTSSRALCNSHGNGPDAFHMYFFNSEMVKYCPFHVRSLILAHLTLTTTLSSNCIISQMKRLRNGGRSLICLRSPRKGIMALGSEPHSLGSGSTLLTYWTYWLNLFFLSEFPHPPLDSLTMGGGEVWGGEWSEGVEVGSQGWACVCGSVRAPLSATSVLTSPRTWKFNEYEILLNCVKKPWVSFIHIIAQVNFICLKTFKSNSTFRTNWYLLSRGLEQISRVAQCPGEQAKQPFLTHLTATVSPFYTRFLSQ